MTPPPDFNDREAIGPPSAGKSGGGVTLQKTKAIHKLEERLETLDPASLRYRVLECAKHFKSSWIQLGQHLFTVHRDKLFRDWGYLTFEAYCAKEIGIRQATALKLLRSYSFLEKEEPSFLKRETIEDLRPSRIPGYEAVNALRLAKTSGKISEGQYEDLRETVLDEAKEDAEVKKKIRYLLKAAPGSSGAAAPAAARKLSAYLENFKKEAADGFPPKVSKKIDELLDLLADYLKQE